MPHIYAYDPSRDIIACDYYMMDFVEGVPLFGAREKMSDEALSRTDRESGEMLRQLNAIEGSRYGIYAQATHDSWRKAFEWLFMSLLADGKAIGVDLPYEELERRYREAIPVVEVEGAEVARYHVDAHVLEAALRSDGETFVRSL